MLTASSRSEEVAQAAARINDRDGAGFQDHGIEPNFDPAFEGAVRLARTGVPVLPIRVQEKIPHITEWTERATCDLKQLEVWHRQFPGCNWGGLTGKRAGRLLIESDPRAGGEDGIAELERQYGELPETETYLSGSGGRHRIYAWPGADVEITSSASRIAIGVDVKGRGSMGLLPGSLHKSGNRYQLLDDRLPAQLPDAWVELLRSQSAAESTNRAYDGPEALIEPILAGCVFMQHAQDDAATLSEEDWWMAVNIAANTEDGIAHAHDLSRTYPGYDSEETQAKAERAIAQDSPHRCKTIEERTGGQWCRGCTHRGKITSPLLLGLPKPTIMRTWETLSFKEEPTEESPSNTDTPPVSDRKFKFQTAREIGASTPERPQWICHGLVAPGSITEIDGRAKAGGKTTFALTMLSCIFAGRRFLELPTRRTKAVYLTEQTPGTFREALRRAGLLDSEDLTVLCFADTKGAPWTEVLSAAVDVAIEMEAELLIVDTLPQFAGLKGDAENNAGSALEAVLPLQLAASHGLAVVAIRHDRKGGGSVGESGRGSSAYAGAVDIILQLVKPEGQVRPTIRQMNGLSRYDETPETLVFELTDAGYISHGDETAVKTSETRKALLEALTTEEDGAQKTDELAKEVDASRGTVKKVLDELLKEGLVSKKGTGKSGSPYLWWAAGSLSDSLGDGVLTDTNHRNGHSPTPKSLFDTTQTVGITDRHFPVEEEPTRYCDCGEPLQAGEKYRCRACVDADYAELEARATA